MGFCIMLFELRFAYCVSCIVDQALSIICCVLWCVHVGFCCVFGISCFVLLCIVDGFVVFVV